MSAWDLSRRLEQSTQQPTATVRPHGPNQIYQLQQHLLTRPTNLWQKLTFNEQFHALLATATRAVAFETAAAINTTTVTTNIVPYLSQIQSYNKKSTPSSQRDLIGPVLFTNNPILDCNTSSTPTPKLDLSQVDNRYSILNESESARKSSLTSSRSLTPSLSSSRSNSSESVDLSFAKRLTPLVADNNDDHGSTNYSLSSRASCSSISLVSFDGSSDRSTRIGPVQVVADKRSRKKDQNRRAAFNYSRKKMEEREKMIEEEARLVHKHVRLAGKIARLEEKILTMLSTKTKQIQNKDGQTMCYQCPVCTDLCDTVTNLRNHLRAKHLNLICMDNCQSIWDSDPNKKVFGCLDENRHDKKDGNHYGGEFHSSLFSIDPERSVVNDNFVDDNIGNPLM